MSPTLIPAVVAGVLAGWRARPDVLAGLAVLMAVYARGWTRLQSRGYAGLASARGLTLYVSGVAAMAVALVSPVDALQPLRLSVHMIQHELLMIVAPPLVLLGRPLGIVLWGIPDAAREWVGDALRPHMPLRRVFDALSRPAVAWSVSTGLLWVWHIPAAYDAVENNGLLHNIQHLLFVCAGLLFWWPVIQAPPYSFSITLPGRVGYLVAGMMQRSLLGGIIMLSNRVLYEHYLVLLRMNGPSPLNDQHVAGSIMWFGSGFLLLGATLFIIWRAQGDDGIK